MILSLTDITGIIKNRPNRQLVLNAQLYAKKLTMHITGAGLAGYIEKLDYFEKQELFNIRLKYSRSNKDMFARLHRPVDKIFTANGGSVNYNLPESQKAAFVNILNHIEYGYSLRNWIKVFWRHALHCDPMGLIMMEVDAEGDTYPTYKSVQTVYDYKLTGRQPEYVVFETDEKIAGAAKDDKRKLYRVVDDAMDYLVAWDGKEVSVLADRSFVNHYGKVPAWIISDIYDPQQGMYVSPDDAVVELADQYLREGGILNVFRNNFGFPQRWRYMGDCDKCNGTGSIEGNTCNACNGSGKKHKYDVSQDINLPIPDKDDPILAPPAGNIEAAVDSWDKMDSSLSNLYSLIYETKWGVQHRVQTQGINGSTGNIDMTATQAVLDEQPKIEALYAYSAAAEHTEKMIADYVGAFYFPNSYKGADINYGRRLMLETPDKIMEVLMALISKEAPYEVVRGKMEAYYHTLYQGDSNKLNIMLKLIDVEPLPFYPMSKAKQLLSPLEYAKKAYYNDWRGLPQTAGMLMTANVEKLRRSLLDYTLQRMNADASITPQTTI